MKILDNDKTFKLLNMDEASSFLGIKKSTLYSLCMQRKIPVAKIGKLNRFRRQDLDRWVESHIQGQN